MDDKASSMSNVVRLRQDVLLLFVLLVVFVVLFRFWGCVTRLRASNLTRSQHSFSPTSSKMEQRLHIAVRHTKRPVAHLVESPRAAGK